MNAVGKIYELSQSTGIELSFSDESEGFGFVCTCKYGTYTAKGDIMGTKKAAKHSAAAKMLEILRGKPSKAATIPVPETKPVVVETIIANPRSIISVQPADSVKIYPSDPRMPLPPGIKFYPAIKKGSEDITLFSTFCFIAADVARNWPVDFKSDVLYAFVGTNTDIREYILKAFTPPIDQNRMYPNIRQHVVDNTLAGIKLIYMNAGALLAMGKQCSILD